jgi:hypothetical protein
MNTPATSSLFTPWVHPSTGVTSYILTRRVAPVQQPFYYTHPSFTDDGRFLWLGCGFPPDGGTHAQQVLGVVDFEADELRVYHETQFPSARPWVDHATGEVYWGNHLDIWKRGPLATDRTVRVNTLPPDLIRGLRLNHLATHPTFSADRKSFNIDARLSKSDGTPVSLIGDMPLDGGPFRLWQKTEGFNYDHGLFNPIDPDLQLFAHEFWQDGARTGKTFDGSLPYHRIWLIRRGEKAAPLLKAPVSHSGHEWWDASGRYIWYLHYGVGVKKVDLATREEILVWPGALSHAHSSRDSRYLVADRMDDPDNAGCHVLFFDTLTGKQIEIINQPPLPAQATKCVHLHPHPQFCLNDRYICYATIAQGRVDVALVSVDDLVRQNR